METDYSDDEVLIVEPLDATLDDYIAKPYISENLRGQLKRAHMLIVPVPLDVSIYTDAPVVFARGTQELFSFLREHAPEGFIADVCIADDDFQEIDQRSSLVEIGTIILQQGALPVALGLLTNYISSKFGRRKTNIQIEITEIRPDGSSRRLRYKGPVDLFEARVLPAMQSPSHKDLSLPPPKPSENSE